jgi:hypothetical protein
MGNGDGTEVDLVALTGYANSMGKGADAQISWATEQRTNMAATAGTMMANTSGTFKESHAFHAYHQTMVGSAAQCLNDMPQFTAAVSMAAETAAINYADADQLGAFNMKALAGQLDADADALKAGKPSHLYGDMTPVFSGGSSMAKVNETDVTNAFTPVASDSAGADNTPAATTTKPPVKSTQQVQDEFNKMEQQAADQTKKTGSGLTQDQQNMVYGDNGYWVQGSDKDHPVWVPKATHDRKDIEGGIPVTEQHKIDD